MIIMEENARKPHKVALILLWVSILIFSLASPVISKLGHLGAQHPIDGRNPISFCNVLFTGNIIAGVVLYFVHRKSWTKATLSTVSKKSWWLMLFMSILSGVVAPSLFFIGLMLTEVINVVLISTLDVPLTLIFAWMILKERPSGATIVASLVTICGILVTFFLYGGKMPYEMRMMMANIGDGPVAKLLARLPKSGEICIALATVFSIFSAELGRKTLKELPSGVFSVFRMFAGSIIFFVIVLVMLGWVHFIDIFSPYLWTWMLVYGGGIVALGSYLWYKAIAKTSSSEISTASSIQPITGILFSYLILKEIPEYGQIIGGIIIMVGIGIGLYSTLKEKKQSEALPKEATPKAKRSQGFSGL